MSAARRPIYDETEVARMRSESLRGIEVTELNESQGRRACYDARLPVFWPTAPVQLPTRREDVLNLELVKS